ncbi:hypothetical protein [Burkholderia anthina]
MGQFGGFVHGNRRVQTFAVAAGIVRRCNERINVARERVGEIVAKTRTVA